MRRAFVIGTFVFAASSARGDEIKLEGGRAIEGSASVEGDKVHIELESGRMTVPASSVTEIKRSTTALEQAKKREAALGVNDVPGLMQLADFCREHELRAKERALLARVIAVSPEHGEARRRLGFVRSKEGWIDGAELARRAELARLQQRREKLELEQREAELALTEAKLARARAEAEQAEANRTRGAQPAAQTLNTPSYFAPFTPTYPGYGFYPPYPGFAARGRHEAGAHSQGGPGAPAPYTINGVRDPRDTSFSLPGVRDPRTYFSGGEAARRR